MVFGWRPIHTVLTGGPWPRYFVPKMVYGAIQLTCALHLFAAYVGYPKATAGPSMLPTLNAQGDCVWINTQYRRGRGIEVGDVVSFHHPLFVGMGASKRVVGMPGDFVMRNSPDSKSDMMVQVPEGHCWLAGDNVPWSRDSRDYGPLPLALIRGKVTWRIWPLTEIQKLENSMEMVKDDRGFLQNR